MIPRDLVRSISHATAVLLFGACSAFASQPGVFDRTIAVTGSVDLDVRSDPGGIVITASSASAVRVHAVIKPMYGRLDLDLAEANIRALEQNPPIEQVGNRIRVGYVKDPALLRGITMHLEIEVPQATQAHAYTESGAIHIDGINGPLETAASSGRTEITNIAADVKVTGHSGAIVIRNVGGHVSIHNQSGGIQLTGIHGDVEAESASGRTEISDVSGAVRAEAHSGGIDAVRLTGSVHAETSSGAIHISQTTAAPIRAVASSGAIKVELAAQSGYTIDAKSHSGRVTAPIGNTFDRTADEHSLKAQVGAGGPLVDLDTHSSRIEIN